MECQQKNGIFAYLIYIREIANTTAIKSLNNGDKEFELES